MKLGAKLATGTQVILEAAGDVLGDDEKRAGIMVTEPIDIEYFGSPPPNRSVLSPSDDESDDGGLAQSTSGGVGAEKAISRYADQPHGVKEGVKAGYRGLGRNLNAAAQTILAVPMEVYERTGNEVSHFETCRVHQR